MAPRRHTLPELNLEFIKPEDKIILANYEEIIRHYTKDIFLDNYPNVITLHSFFIMGSYQKHLVIIIFTYVPVLSYRFTKTLLSFTQAQ